LPPRIEGQLADALIENLSDPCLGIDRSGDLRLFNRLAGRLFGLKPKEVIGRNVLEALPLNDFTRAFIGLVKSSDPVPSEQVMVFPENRLFAVQMTPVRTSRGRNLGAIAVLRDMAGVQKIERGLDQIIEDMIQRISVPLTSIKGFVETLLEGSYRDQEITHRFLQIINEETNRLVRLVMSLEETAHSGEAPTVFRSRGRLEPIVEAALEMFRPAAANKGVDLQIEQGEDLPWVSLDFDLLQRALVNLVDNAVRFTGLRGEGKVLVRTAFQDREVLVVVQDDGVGITPEDLPRIFERFYRTLDGPGAELGGTGLGLSVALEIVEAHGGRIEVQSTPGEGTTFTVRLPVVHGN
jgi:two-component system phosphate regulon sensor histidine kinase PhoR